MLALLKASYARLPKVERPALEVLLAGYFRISRTDGLIRHAMARADDGDDFEFWSRAAQEEHGHADLYRADLLESLGAGVVEDIAAYVPSPSAVALLAWADESNRNAALYRLYLEYHLCRADADAVAALARFLPRSMAVHRAADPVHVADCADYLARFGGDFADDIGFIEHCLGEEMRHIGLVRGVVTT